MIPYIAPFILFFLGLSVIGSTGVFLPLDADKDVIGGLLIALSVMWLVALIVRAIRRK